MDAASAAVGSGESSQKESIHQPQFPPHLPPPLTRQPVLATFSRSVPRSSCQRKQRAGAVKPKVKQGGTRHQRSQYATAQPGRGTHPECGNSCQALGPVEGWRVLSFLERTQQFVLNKETFEVFRKGFDVRCWIVEHIWRLNSSLLLFLLIFS